MQIAVSKRQHKLAKAVSGFGRKKEREREKSGRGLDCWGWFTSQKAKNFNLLLAFVVVVVVVLVGARLALCYIIKFRRYSQTSCKQEGIGWWGGLWREGKASQGAAAAAVAVRASASTLMRFQVQIASAKGGRDRGPQGREQGTGLATRVTTCLLPLSYSQRYSPISIRYTVSPIVSAQ